MMLLIVLVDDVLNVHNLATDPKGTHVVRSAPRGAPQRLIICGATQLGGGGRGVLCGRF